MKAGEDRFEMLGELGSGGMGRVFRVLDRVRGEEVALKTVRATSGRDLFRFKREFRALTDLVHPNLVALFEMFTVENEWMFTMELVKGIPFRDWVRPDGATGMLAEGRLRDALAQLADGLTALHAARKVHRDLKPSNVMVQDDGRVVIFDFGLVSDIDLREQTHLQSAVGTPAYMAPEQAADQPVTAASDWYSVGTMLYEVLAGRRPYTGSPASIVVAKQKTDPPPLDEIAPDSPPDLARLCMALLARDPAKRPSDEAVLDALGRRPSPWTRRIIERAARVLTVSRDRELAVLRDAARAARDHVTTVMVVGPCGSGKTTLLQTFGDEMAAEGAAVLHGRADPRETMTFRALDHVVDSLATHLLSLPRAEVAAMIPPGIALLARVFPALKRVPEAQVPLLPGELPADEDELRQRALRTMTEIVRRLTERQPVVVFLDDVQWSSPLGAEMMLDDFQGELAPRVLFVFGFRTEAIGNPVWELLSRWQGDRRTITLQALPAVLPGGDDRPGS